MLYKHQPVLQESLPNNHLLKPIIITMGLKLLVIVLLIKIVAARITLDVSIENQEANVIYSGSEAHVLTDNEIDNIIGRETLRQAFIEHLRLRGYYHDKDSCGPPKKVVSIKSAIVKRMQMEPVIVVSQDFENLSNQTVKMNTGISHSVENTLKTSWSREHEYNISKNVEYEVNVGFLKFLKIGADYHSRSGFSFTTRGGVSEEKSKTETIGTTSGMEVELKPGAAVTVALSSNTGVVELEVVHEAYLKGDVRVHCNCDIPFGLRIHVKKACEPIEELMVSGNIRNNITTTETIKFNYFVGSKIRVFNKQNGQLIL